MMTNANYILLLRTADNKVFVPQPAFVSWDS